MSKLRSHPATVDAGPVPTTTFTRVGVLGGDTIDVPDGLTSSDVYRCERCKALVLAADAADHLAHHAQHGMERWPDRECGNLARDDTEEHPDG